MTDTKQMLLDNVLSIVERLESEIEVTQEYLDEHPDQADWLDVGDQLGAASFMEDSLDVSYTIGADGSYRGSEILVAFGGPNIEVNTQFNIVEGRWGGDVISRSYSDNIGLDDHMEAMCRYLLQDSL